MSKDDNTKEGFEKILEDYIPPLEKGAILEGRVVKIGENSALINIGTKTEGFIPINELKRDGNIIVKEGQKLEAKVVEISNALGQIKLSSLELRIDRDYERVKKAYESGEYIDIKIIKDVDRGFIGYAGEIESYIPKSHIDFRRNKKEDAYYIDKTLKCKILKIDSDRKTILASHRMYLEEKEKREVEEFFNKVKVGDILKGKVKVLKNYGVFVGLGPVDAFLYKGNISWGIVKDPTFYLEVDDVIDVKVINVDYENKKCEVSLKHKKEDPWKSVREKYLKDSIVKGRVVTRKKGGYILEIEEGIDGFVPDEELSWIRKSNISLKKHEVVEGKVLDYDDKNRRIIMSLRLIEPNPWDSIKKKHPEGSVVKGKVKDIKDFGIFIDFGEHIDGLIRKTDISWTENQLDLEKLYKVGDIIEAKVLKIEPEKERIHLGIKQLTQNPWDEIDKLYPIGSVVELAIDEVTQNFIKVKLPRNIKGIVPVSEIDSKKISPNDRYKEGDTIKALVKDIDYKKKLVILSIRLYLLDKEKRDVKDYLKSYDKDETKFSLGSILKDKLNR
ncbi:MAG: S1 RNA-binding domain-containing protein [Deferribacterota bacterium]|nr:S1 RNA-binding domain-containing protein [Deferribacterota bacterium]